MLPGKNREDTIMAVRVSRWISAAAGLAAALAAAVALTAASSAAAEDYPARPVRIIIGFTAGSSGDVAARVLAQRFGARFGQQFVVENRTGAGSNIATGYVAHAPKDGYTLLQATVANTVAAATISNLNFDLVKDFAPVALFTTLPNIVAVHPSTGAANIRDLIALAQAKPGELSFGSAGVGSGSHFTGELFNVMADIKLLHVPYGGTAQVMSDLLAGRVQVMFSPASTVLPQVNDGKLTALASTGLQRASTAPELPTVAESGVPGFDTSGWFGLLAPAGVPRDVVERLALATTEAAKSPDVAAALRPLGYDMEGGSPEAFAAFIRADLEKWSRVAAATGLKR
jgi:tripartite-type tricarboxylate transporter receptor subunit TctC